MSFSSRLKEATQFRNYRQVDLVNATHINKGTISNYLSGKYEPKSDNLISIAHTLKVNVRWLLEYENVPIEIDQYVEYSPPKEKEESYTTFKWEENFDENISQDNWNGYYEKIMSMPEPLRIETLKYVMLMIAMADMKKKYKN